MAVDLRTTQEYLNAKLGTVGLTKQQCLQRLFGPAGSLASNPMTAQDAARNYAGLSSIDNTVQNSLRNKVGGATARDWDITEQEAARRL